MGVLMMLMTICGLIAAGILLVVAATTRKKWLRTFVLGGVATWLVGYTILLFAGSVFSVERTLAVGEPKEYCGFYFDCHLHTSVTGVRTAKTIGDRAANGEFYIVTVRVFSDARREPLALNTVDAHVVDAEGRAYTRDMQTEAQLQPQPDFEKRIAPTESFEKQIVFDLPSDAKTPRLDIREGYGIDHALEAVLIGDEDSILHKRNYFKIQEQTDTAGVK